MMGEFLKKRWFLVIALVYVILPFDFVPDSLPIVGNIDDSLVLLAGVVKQYIDFQKENNEKEK